VREIESESKIERACCGRLPIQDVYTHTCVHTYARVPKHARTHAYIISPSLSCSLALSRSRITIHMFIHVSCTHTHALKHTQATR
jgi:hypothetical protein